MKRRARRALDLVVLVMMLASACTTSVSSTPASLSTPIDKGEVGQEKQSQRIFVTIVRTRRLLADQICNIALSDDFDLCHTRTGDVGDVILVETIVRNQTDRPLDLSCVDEIQDALLDGQGNRFPSTGRLDLFVNNPRCGELLEAKQERTMIYAYQLPQAAPFATWIFSNSTNPNDSPTTFNIADDPTISTGRP